MYIVKIFLMKTFILSKFTTTNNNFKFYLFLKSKKIIINQLTVEIIFLNYGGLCWRDFFRLHWRKWIRDVTGTNTVFDVEAGNSKQGFFFGRRLWWEQTTQKGAPHLTAE